MAEALIASCVWLATEALLVALDARFGEPIDTYVNGSQVWIRDDGPAGAVLEWRLHPVAGYHRPAGVTTEEVFASTALALGTGGRPAAPLDQLWDGLEAFAATDEDRLEPQTLAAAASAALGLVPDVVGLVDHVRVGDDWERSGGRISIIDALVAQLQPA